MRQPPTSRRAALIGLGGMLAAAALPWAGRPAMAAAAAAPIQAPHALGTVVLDRPAQRVVSLEHTVTEDLLALGLVPVGAADIPGYARYVGLDATRLDAATDVGTRQEPSLETIAGLSPDLIVGPAFRHAGLYDTLSAIAPTVLLEVRPSGPDAALADAVDRLRLLAALTGRQDAAEAVVARLDATLAEAADHLAQAGLAGTDVLLVQFLPASAHIRIFGPSSLPGRIAARLGLGNAWTGETDAFGFATTGVEALAGAPEAHLVHVANPDDALFRRLTESPVWQALGPVAQGRVHALPPDTWFFGGPWSAIALAERLTDALLPA